MSRGPRWNRGKPSKLYNPARLTRAAPQAQVEHLEPGGEPADWDNFLLISKEPNGSGELAFAITGTATVNGRPTNVNLTYPEMAAALQGAHWLAAKMGVPVIYVRERD